MTRLITLFVFVAFSAISFASEEIIWLTDDKEDILFLNTNKSYSIGLDTINLVLAELEGFELVIKLTSVSRIEEELKNTKNSCVANRIKNDERAKLNEFSSPVNIHPSPRLYFFTNAINLPKNLIDNDSLTSLSTLMQHNSNKKIVLVKDVSYGESIDKQITNLDEKHVTHINVDNRYNTSSKLFFDGLVDFTIDYPTQMKRQLNKLSTGENIGSLGFGTDAQYIKSHIACSKSDTGKSFITAVNKVLLELYKSDKYLAAHVRHLDESSIPQFTKNFVLFLENLR
jgi:uncharacterized protein (TIGR02285 family)